MQDLSSFLGGSIYSHDCFYFPCSHERGGEKEATSSPLSKHSYIFSPVLLYFVFFHTVFHPSIYRPHNGPFPVLGSRDPDLYCSLLHRMMYSTVMSLRSAARGKQCTYFCVPLRHIFSPDLCVAAGFASV